MNPRPFLIAALGPALLLASALLLPARGLATPYPGVAHLDGYLSASGDCVMLRQHDGRMYALRGDLDGLRSGDHLRLEGRFAPDPGCNAPGFAVMKVQKLWADDNHRAAYFDDRNGEPFARYAERIGRFSDQGGPGQERRDAGGDHDRGVEQERHDRGENGGDGRVNGGAQPERRDNGEPGRDHAAAEPERRDDGEPGRDHAAAQPERRDADRDHPDPERADRNGHYVYQGPHRSVTLVGKLHETEGACPTLNSTRAVFALDGDLREYQAGDDVSISGVLYDGDPNAPCGGPTVVIRTIHGHGRR